MDHHDMTHLGRFSLFEILFLLYIVEFELQSRMCVGFSE